MFRTVQWGRLRGCAVVGRPSTARSPFFIVEKVGGICAQGINNRLPSATCVAFK
jgi:hypothetical protein